jgi:hypothetical protein
MALQQRFVPAVLGILLMCPADAADYTYKLTRITIPPSGTIAGSFTVHVDDNTGIPSITTYSLKTKHVFSPDVTISSKCKLCQSDIDVGSWQGSLYNQTIEFDRLLSRNGNQYYSIYFNFTPDQSLGWEQGAPVVTFSLQGSTDPAPSGACQPGQCPSIYFTNGELTLKAP